MRWIEMERYQIRDDKVQFGLASRIGVLKPLSYGRTFHTGALYHATFGDDSFSSPDIKVGFVWKF